MRWPLSYGMKTRLMLVLGMFAAASFSVQDAQAYTFDTLDGQTCAAPAVHVPASPNLMVFADSSASMRVPVESGPGTVTTQQVDIFEQGSSDEGLKLEPGSAADNPRGEPGLTLSKKTVIPPYAWIANNQGDTVSKFNMKTNKEEGRYWVGGNPSRTAVDLDGNAWITTRDHGWVTKILWNSEECPARADNGVPNTSSGTDVLGRNTTLNRNNDDCVVYQVQPKPAYYSASANHTLRGVAAGPDGRVWIGYSNRDGGIQSIEKCASCDGGHELGTFYPAKNIPEFKEQSDGVFRATGANMDGGHAYGLVLDAQGVLYYVSWSWDRFLAFDTKTKTWKASYHTPGTRWQYGIALDAEGRIWMGSYPDGSGVKMFDPRTSKVYYYPHSRGVVTGLAVEPGTGDVWASFYGQGVTGRLRLPVDSNGVSNPNGVTDASWTLIPTLRKDGPSSGRLDGLVSWDLRGVGFDIDGYAWTMGNNSDRIYKIDPKTNRRHVDMLTGKSVGHGQHYTYSDFTGSTALSFTAPSGKWSEIYDVGGKQVLSITVQGHVPTGTNVGVRYRGLDADGVVISPWSPAVTGGSENYEQFAEGQQQLTIQIPQSNDNPFVVDQIQIEVRLSTSDKGVRPYLYGVSMDINGAQSMWEDAQNVAADLSDTFGVDGGCPVLNANGEVDGTGCDTVRVGLSYFSDVITEVTGPGEDTGDELAAGAASAGTGGLTGIDQVAAALLNHTGLQDEARSNFALIVTDGKFNTINQVSSAVRDLCLAKMRSEAPVKTYVMGPGAISDMKMNSLLAAAGGTGQCCLGNHAGCTDQQVKYDPCDALLDPGVLGGVLVHKEGHLHPYTQVELTTEGHMVSCFGATPSSEVTQFKVNLADVSREDGCTFKLDIPEDPEMYNKPDFPQLGALLDPAATRVDMFHKDWSLVTVPYCKPGVTPDAECNFSEALVPLNVDADVLEKFAVQGWYFIDDDKRDEIRLTDALCSEIAAGRVLNTRSQVACQCSLQGQACEVDGKFGRCAVGVYACDEGEVNICKQVHRPMPEVCNGLDDDCDGLVDNLSETSAVVPALPEEYAVLECLQRDACVCPNGPLLGYLGTGGTAAEELEDYLSKTLELNTGCYCASGLEAEKTVKASTEAVSAQNGPVKSRASGGKGAACSVSSGLGSDGDAGGVAFVSVLAGAAVWWRRLRRD